MWDRCNGTDGGIHLPDKPFSGYDEHFETTNHTLLKPMYREAECKIQVAEESLKIASIFVTTTVSVVTAVSAILSHLIRGYDKDISRIETLLTKLNGLLSYPIFGKCLADIITGVRLSMQKPFTQSICKVAFSGRIFLRFWTVLILANEAVFHYRYITFQSYFPIINEGLLYRAIILSTSLMALTGLF